MYKFYRLNKKDRYAVSQSDTEKTLNILSLLLLSLRKEHEVVSLLFILLCIYITFISSLLP